MNNNKYIDLHVHSNNSDGTFMPKQLVDMAYDNNVGILSVTDHDSICGLEELKSSIPDGMFGVKGVEISSYVYDNNEKIKIHILGYCYDENNNLFQSLLNEMREKRLIAHKRVLEELKKKSIELSYDALKIEKYCWFDREVIKYLKQLNYSLEVIQELEQNYKRNVFTYGKDYEIDAKKVIEVIHSAGGYVVFAHPMAYRFSKDKDIVYRIIKKLVELGIDGIEIFQSDCLIENTLWLKNITNEYSLLYSVGSDFHRYINSDGRKIGLGINNNLCITETTLTDEIIKTKKYFRKGN